MINPILNQATNPKKRNFIQMQGIPKNQSVEVLEVCQQE